MIRRAWRRLHDTAGLSMLETMFVASLMLWVLVAVAVVGVLGTASLIAVSQ